MKSFPFLLVSVVLFSLATLGCKPAESESTATTAETDAPKTLKDGLDELNNLYATIKSAFESDDPDAAHSELHKVAHLLDGGFPGLIEGNESLSEDAKNQLTSVLSGLLDEFHKLDGHVHGDGDVEFSEVDQAISTKLEELKGLIQ